MKRFIRGHQFASLIIALASVLLALVIVVLTVQNHRAVTKAHLIPAVTIYHAAPTGGGPIWGGETWVPSPFRRAQLHHPWCGRRISPQIRGIHGIYRMRFARCTMAFGPIKVYRLPVATALPEQGIVGGILGGTVTPRPIRIQPPPTPQPFATRLPPAPIATATALPPGGASNDSAAYELSLLNATRAHHGLFAYTENITQSNGTGSCAGSIGHSHDMAASGSIWHVNPAYPSASFPNNLCLQYSAAGENVGEASGSVTQALDTIHGLMLQEPYTPGCSGSHVCSILSSAYRQVGIGVYVSGGITWLTVDFAG